MKTLISALTLVVAAAIYPAVSEAGVFVSVNIAPPALPLYAQPPMPGDGYLWTPGYWSWNEANNDYYWVPGTWVMAPFVGALWTPGYWGWGDGYYRWHGGYWGTHIGYYGGVNYGYGYFGAGYRGGYWNNGRFNYNRTVNNVTNVRNVHIYNSPVPGANQNRVSYSGGKGGMRMQPTKEEEMISNMPHNPQTEPQARHETATYGNQGQRVSVNHGMPAIAATPEPGKFNSQFVMPSREAPKSNPPRQQSAPRSAPSHGSGHHR